jgi:hypothetical protein
MMVTTQKSIPAFHLSGIDETSLGKFILLEFGRNGTRVRMHSPKLTPSLLSKVIAGLRKSRNDYLARLPVYSIIETIDKVAVLWADPSYHLRRRAEELLPAITGYSPQMIAKTLDGIVSMFTARNLELLLAEEFGDPLFLDEFRPRPQIKGLSKAYGPPLTTHVFSGNVPGLPALSLVSALLVKSASLGKAASEEPFFPVLFARSLSEVDPKLASCIAILRWKGGDEELERVAFGSSDAVIVYGSEEAVAGVQNRVPRSTRFIGYGHKLSFGVIGRQYLTRDRVKETAARAASDTSVYDQQGCLSPHLFYVEEGAEATPAEFSKLLAVEMEAFNQKIPRGQTSPAESAKIHQLRGTYELKEFAGEDVAVHTSNPGTDWTVIYESDPTFVPSCLNRTIRVKPIEDISEVAGLVEPMSSYLQTVGAALSPERLLILADALGRLGMDRICPLGKMPDPSIGWHHDGRFNLLDLVRWTDIEEIAPSILPLSNTASSRPGRVS